MLKLLLKILVLQPELLHEHAQGYADLATRAWTHNLRTLKYRWTMYAISALTLFLSLILGGVALMLWCTLPTVEMRNTWIWAYARNLRKTPLLDKIKEQVQLDILALRKEKNS